ncbi:bacterial alpha-L-rhamnosidase domain protein [Cladophialophora carrionii]|uniref:alpha-L-rhamnosidase n=1 Tax=Cladophialophora carrionii TaxID=86049 RepID=A0A1C1CLM9_9EURO|nr:bacterial alpha-L-rhamnosidase domain protein [Cladophialophora carrionii]
MALASRPFAVTDVRFEHYLPEYALGVHELQPRVSWRFQNAPEGFQQQGYELELVDIPSSSQETRNLGTFKVESSASALVPWPHQDRLQSRQRVGVRVRVWDGTGCNSEWSEQSVLEVGLLNRQDWKCQRITTSWPTDPSRPGPEHLFRKQFSTRAEVAHARLYITAQGLYEANINGTRVGDQLLTPGWTDYSKRLQYQTYDVTQLVSPGPHENCIGVRLAEGWFCGRIGFEGGRRNIWGSQMTLLAQLEIQYADGVQEVICTDDTWQTTLGPTRLAEIYDGEKYDANLEIPGWSTGGGANSGVWRNATALENLPETTKLIAGTGEPVRAVEVLKPVRHIQTPSGKSILDFGQNCTGYTRIKKVRGVRGQTITLFHAEVLEHGELGRRPLRQADACDQYTFSGATEGESWEPRFTFHGFRYVQVDGWPASEEAGNSMMDSFEVVVCHSAMEPVGTFSCSDPRLEKLHTNVKWSMRSNFVSIPTDCPQRDERLGWTGDLALFAPAATLLYNCYGLVANWLVDVRGDQDDLDGIPPVVSPNVVKEDFVWGEVTPFAIWHDCTILGPWALYQATGDSTILATSYESMTTWLDRIPRNKTRGTILWDPNLFQLGDWLDPSASPHNAAGGQTDSILVADAFLIHSLETMANVCAILEAGSTQADAYRAAAERYRSETQQAKSAFQNEYISPSGRVVSDSQAAYALAIVFDLFETRAQKMRAGERLAEIVRRNDFKVGTGFAGTPFVCEALALANQTPVAYGMLLNEQCPSWLYPVTMGATTVWERWDSMLPDGTINPGSMTSFNHYAFGAVITFFYERIVGLKRLEPGWKRASFTPAPGGGLTHSQASVLTPYGELSCTWSLDRKGGEQVDGEQPTALQVAVVVPANVVVELVLPSTAADLERKQSIQELSSGTWSFCVPWVGSSDAEWPVKPIHVNPFRP